MNDRLFDNIEFLLTTNNCVVIPNLGGFLLNREDASCDDPGHTLAPIYSIAFNPDLKYNDGLLTHLVSKQNGVNYNSASQLINAQIGALKKELTLYDSTPCGSLGSLRSNNGNITFSPNKGYIHPNTYGLSDIKLNKLRYIQRTEKETRRHLSFNQVLHGATAAAVALFLFLLPQGGMNEESSTNVQTASFTQTVVRLQQSSIAIEPARIISPTLDKIAEVEAKQETIINRCFVILASATDADNAESILKGIQKSDFPDASIIKSNGRYRIYSHAFPKRVEAEAFLTKFREANPKYNTAWVHIKQ